MVVDGAGAGGCSKTLGDVAGALAVLSGSVLAPDDSGLSKLGWITRVEAPTKILAWPPAPRDQRRCGKVLRGHPEACQWPEETSRAWWAADAVPPTNSLAGKQAGGTERWVATANGFVAVGCARPPGNFALTLVVLSRSRLAPEVTGRSKLDGIARMWAPAKILA